MKTASSVMPRHVRRNRGVAGRLVAATARMPAVKVPVRTRALYPLADLRTTVEWSSGMVIRLSPGEFYRVLVRGQGASLARITDIRKVPNDYRVMSVGDQIIIGDWVYRIRRFGREVRLDGVGRRSVGISGLGNLTPNEIIEIDGEVLLYRQGTMFSLILGKQAPRDEMPARRAAVDRLQAGGRIRKLSLAESRTALAGKQPAIMVMPLAEVEALAASASAGGGAGSNKWFIVGVAFAVVAGGAYFYFRRR